MSNYNYDGFSAASYNLDQFHGPVLGAKAPDFELSTADGNKVKLLDFEGDFLVLELGSITCPLFQGRRDGMNDLVAQYPNISFGILYVREAHPGSNIKAHKTDQDKTACAVRLKDSDHEMRQIFIDDLEGTAHSAYGSYPNAMFIINKNGCVVFQSDWNIVPATKTALNKLMAGQPAHNKSYFRPVKPTTALKVLRKNGKGAAKDFFASLPTLIWKNLIKRNFLLLFNADKMISPDAEC